MSVLADLQRTAGNQAVQRLLQRQSASASGATHIVHRAPEIEATNDAVATRVTEQLIALNAGGSAADKGVHYAHNYQQRAQRFTVSNMAAYQAYATFWKDDYWKGYADPQYFERVCDMNWVLKGMVSAAAAIKAWLKGPTIAECFTSLVAIKLDTIRAAIGDDKFDALYSDFPGHPPKKGRMRINYGSQGLTESLAG